MMRTFFKGMNPRRAQSGRSGFTLIELLVVIAIIAILIALLVTAVQKVRETAVKTQCANNLKVIGLGFHSYHDVFKALPPSRVDTYGGPTWCLLILPFIEQTAVFELWDMKKSYFHQTSAMVQSQIPTYYCPARRSAADNMLSNLGDGGGTFGALGDYAVCDGDNSDDFGVNTANGAIILSSYGYREGLAAHWNSLTKLDSITDGISNTFLAGEKHVIIGQFGAGGYNDINNLGGDGSIWNGPYPEHCSRIAGPSVPLALSPASPWGWDGFGSWHKDICQFVMCDGSVKAIAVSIDLQNYRRLGVRNDGEPITRPARIKLDSRIELR
jgi:prepilin-type N-terminal cleavage/methylation domain-containing protein